MIYTSSDLIIQISGFLYQLVSFFSNIIKGLEFHIQNS